MANQGGNNLVLRDYRKGNWTIEETMVLIEAKKMDDERRMMKSERGGNKQTEQRWKWVEDYCWKKGCFRSQSQCNDKWDNLMRDFKKVREYEKRIMNKDNDHERLLSYWKIDKNERKDKNLPSNMLFQIYEALVDVVERKGCQKVVVIGGGGGGGGERTFLVGQPSLLPPIIQHSTQNPTWCALPPPRPPSPPLAQAQPPPPQIEAQPSTSTMPTSQPLPIVDSDVSEHSDSPAKRRRKTRGEGASSNPSGDDHHHHSHEVDVEVGLAISKSAEIIAEAIQSSKDREEKRHKEILNLHERRLQIEESKAEITKQGINGLVDAINKLANSILVLASNNNQVTPN